MPSALEGVSGQQHAPAALYPRERPGTHFTGGWVGPRAGLDGRKISSPPGFDPGPSRQKLIYLSFNKSNSMSCSASKRGQFSNFAERRNQEWKTGFVYAN